MNDLSRVNFGLKLKDAGVIKAGDVSLIEYKIKYPFFFKEYKERSKGQCMGLPIGRGTTGAFYPGDFF